MDSFAVLAPRIEAATARNRHAFEKYRAERDFALFLIQQQADRKNAWQRLLQKADALVARAVTGGSDSLGLAVAEAEKILAPLQPAAKSYVCHCIGHGHIDMNWMWCWPETVAVTNDTFRTVLNLMHEFPDFTYSQSQASVYRIIEQYNPEMLPEIARRIKEGRWEVTASHWVETDKNMVNGESLCRHILLTKKYMQQLFGLNPDDLRIDWAPDTFGHALTVPTYLAAGGIDYCYLHRPGIHGPERPFVFVWRAPDGSEILVRNDMKLAYNGVPDFSLGRHLAEYSTASGLKDFIFVYGVGDHGGGPTRKDLRFISEMRTWPVFPEICFSRADAYFAAISRHREKLPVITCELNTEFTGCYTTQSLIKKANRLAENRLADAEFANLLATRICGRKTQASALNQAWEDTLFSQFHDILPGSGVHDTRTFSHGLFQKIAATTAMQETNAYRALAACINTEYIGTLKEIPELPVSAARDSLGSGSGIGSGKGALSQAVHHAGADWPFVLFNPTGKSREEIATLRIWDLGQQRGGSASSLSNGNYMITNADGSSSPAQKKNHGEVWGHSFLDLDIPVSVPPFGYAVCTVSRTDALLPPSTAAAAKQLRVRHNRFSIIEMSSQGLENEHVRVEIDPATGGIIRFLDRQSGLLFIDEKTPAPLIEFHVERPHSMSSWLLAHPMQAETPRLKALRNRGEGPWSASIELDYEIRESRFTLVYELKQGDPKLYLHLKGTWLEPGGPERGVPALGFAFPLAMSNCKTLAEIPFGAVNRSLNQGEELPALQWVAATGKISGKNCGCLLLNDSKYGYSLNGGKLCQSLIRSGYEPDPLPEIGEHEIRTALMPFQGAVDIADCTRDARVFNHPLRAVSTDRHKGTLPGNQSIMNISPAELIISALKTGEDGKSIIIRAYNTGDKPIRAELKLNPVFVPGIKQAYLTDLLERKIPGRVTVQKQTLRFPVPAHAIVTVAVLPTDSKITSAP